MPEACQPGDFQIRTERLWSSVAPIAIGECPVEPGMPDEIVVIDRSQEPFMRLHIHYPPLEYHLRTEVKIWSGWVVTGFAGRVVLVSIHDGLQRTIALSDVSPPDSFDYFCQLFSDDDVLLACSGRRVFASARVVKFFGRAMNWGSTGFWFMASIRQLFRGAGNGILREDGSHSRSPWIQVRGFPADTAPTGRDTSELR